MQLILIPTEFEAAKVRQILSEAHPQESDFAIELVGFGPIISAARSSQLLSRLNPSGVTLLGIAGLYQTQRTAELSLQPGTATTFNHVSCYGVGAGQGERFQTATELGWELWNPTLPNSNLEANTSISETIPLAASSGATAESRNELLTVCSAAASDAEVATRLAKFPFAIGEDMEGFGVASACRLHNIPCRIIRGFSNIAGDRDHSNWQVDKALSAACGLLTRE